MQQQRPLEQSLSVPHSNKDDPFALSGLTNLATPEIFSSFEQSQSLGGLAAAAANSSTALPPATASSTNPTTTAPATTDSRRSSSNEKVAGGVAVDSRRSSNDSNVSTQSSGTIVWSAKNAKGNAFPHFSSAPYHCKALPLTLVSSPSAATAIHETSMRSTGSGHSSSSSRCRDPSTGKLLIGQLPGTYAETDIESLLLALSREGGFVLDRANMEVSIHEKNRTCAFVTMKRENMLQFLPYNRRLMCDHQCVWLTPSPAVAAQVSQHIQSLPREQLRGLAKALVVFEAVASDKAPPHAATGTRPSPHHQQQQQHLSPWAATGSSVLVEQPQPLQQQQARVRRCGCVLGAAMPLSIPSYLPILLRCSSCGSVIVGGSTVASCTQCQALTCVSCMSTVVL